MWDNKDFFFSIGHYYAQSYKIPFHCYSSRKLPLEIIWTTINNSIKASELTNDSYSVLDKKIRFFSFLFFWERERESLEKILQASNNEITYKTWRTKHPLITQECKLLQEQTSVEITKPVAADIQNQTSVASSLHLEGAFEDLGKLEFRHERKRQRINPRVHIYRRKRFGGILTCTHHAFSCIRSQSPSMYFVLWHVKYEQFYKQEVTLLAWYLTISANPESLTETFKVFSPFLTLSWAHLPSCFKLLGLETLKITLLSHEYVVNKAATTCTSAPFALMKSASWLDTSCLQRASLRTRCSSCLAHTQKFPC